MENLKNSRVIFYEFLSGDDEVLRISGDMNSYKRLLSFAVHHKLPVFIARRGDKIYVVKE